MKTRRDLLTASVGLGAATLAGCLDAVVGHDIVAESELARVSGRTASRSGYEMVERKQVSVEETVEVGEEEREIDVTNWITGYEKRMDSPDVERDLAVFYVLSTPDVRVVGQQVNPLSRYGAERLVEFANRETDADADVGEIEKESEAELEVLDESTTVTRFESELDPEDDAGADPVPVFLYLGRVEHGDDIVAFLGAHPQELDEEGDVHELARGIEHPVEPDSA